EIFHLMIPGSVIGLVLLFILLISGIVKEKYIRSGANFMMKHLVLFFVPATVGIMGYIDLFKGKGDRKSTRLNSSHVSISYAVLPLYICTLSLHDALPIWEIFHLMIPGSVIGLVLLFILLISGIVKEKYIRSGANFMMKHLVLFFVPATVGIMGYIDLFKGK